MNIPFEINLRRKLTCESYNLMMTISKFEGQNEILAILKLFDEHRSVTKSIVNEELLSQPANSQYGQNVLSAVESYGLIKQNSKGGKYELTDTGNNALDIGKIPFPNRGIFNVLVSYDSLLPREILYIGEIGGGDFAENTNNKSIKSLPSRFSEILEKWLNKTLTLPASNSENVIINKYSPTGINTEYNANFGLSLKVIYGEKPRLYLTGKSDVSLISPNGLDSFNIMKELMKEEGSLKIKEEEPTLLVGIAGLSIADIRAFSRTYNLFDPKLENYGNFEQVRVNNLKIFPKSLLEAKKWAQKLVIDGLDHYVGKTQYDELVRSKCRRFEPTYNFDNIVDGIPSYERAKKMAKSGDAEFKNAFWYLIAPSDLSPRRVPK